MLLELGRVLLYNTKFYTMPSEAASRTRHFKPLSETTEMYYILMKAQLCTILARLSAPHTTRTADRLIYSLRLRMRVKITC